MKIKCVVACNNAYMKPIFRPLVLNCTEAERARNVIIDGVERYLFGLDYENEWSYVVFDDEEDYPWLFAQFDWDEAPEFTQVYITEPVMRWR